MPFVAWRGGQPGVDFGARNASAAAGGGPHPEGVGWRAGEKRAGKLAVADGGLQPHSHIEYGKPGGCWGGPWGAAARIGSVASRKV